MAGEAVASSGGPSATLLAGDSCGGTLSRLSYRCNEMSHSSYDCFRGLRKVEFLEESKESKEGKRIRSRYTAAISKGCSMGRLATVSAALLASSVTVGHSAPAGTSAAQGMSIEQLIDIKHPSAPAWSADGKHIAFTWDRAGVSKRYVSDLDGRPPHEVPEQPTDAAGGVPSPDGTRVAIVRSALNEGAGTASAISGRGGRGGRGGSDWPERALGAYGSGGPGKASRLAGLWHRRRRLVA